MHLTQGLKRAARLRADATALCFEGRQRTWSALERRCAKLGAALQRLGITPDERVAMLARNSDRYVEYYLSTLWCGGVFAPLNHRWALPEMTACIDDCKPRVLLVDKDFADMVEPLQKANPSLGHVIFADDGPVPAGMLDYEELIADTPPMDDAMRGYDDLACLFYTSGATGQPKGVMLSHANLVMNVMNTLPGYGYAEESVGLLAGPLFHLATGSRVFTAVFAMARQVVLRQFDANLALRTIEKEGVTTTQLVPTMVHMILDQRDFAAHDLSKLEVLSYGGSPMPEALLTRLLSALPKVRLLQSYGMTETSPVVTSLPPERHVISGALAGKLKTAGRPVTNVDLRIVDDVDASVDHGTVGEILVHGPSVMKGYWNQPELSARTLRDGWLHTGDMGFLDVDGYLTVVDRKKDMIISGGENVYSTQVEDVIYRHPDVLECAVFGTPHEKWGESVHAIVVAKIGSALDAQSVITHCRDHLAGYKCPRSVDIQTDALPKNGANKIDKAGLRKCHWKGL
jgi:long-chain acyl-CoA synthetase